MVAKEIWKKSYLTKLHPGVGGYCQKTFGSPLVGAEIHLVRRAKSSSESRSSVVDVALPLV